MKVSALFAAVAGVVGLATVSAQAAPVELDLTLAVNTTNQTYQVLGSISGDTSRTTGLAGFQFDVVGAGGLVVTSSSEKAPTGLFFDGTNFFTTGFTSTKSDGTNGLAIHASQDTSNTSNVNFPGAQDIVTGVGFNPAVPNNNATFAYPVVLATGTYSGLAGTLTVSSLPALVTFLPNPLPAATTAGDSVTTFSPDSVMGQTLIVGAPVPEPASMGLLGLGVLALLARRRKAC